MIQNIKPETDLERKMLNVRHEYLSGLIERLENIKESVDYHIEKNKRTRKRHERLLNSMRRLTDNENLDDLDSLIRVMESEFIQLEEMLKELEVLME